MAGEQARYISPGAAILQEERARMRALAALLQKWALQRMAAEAPKEAPKA